MAGAVGGTLVGALVGYFLCGKSGAPAAQPPVPPHFQEEEGAAPPPEPERYDYSRYMAPSDSLYSQLK